MKYLVFILLLLPIGSVYSASIKYFESSEKSEVRFIVLSSSSIRTVIYDEEEKELSVVLLTERVNFHVETLKEAEEITSRIFNIQDSSIITLNKN